MGKFGIGARVRDREGDEGVILDKRKGERYVLYDDTDYGSIWNAKDRLTALEVVANDNEVSACAPVFEKEYSVGDRVRFVEDYSTAKAGDEGVVTGFWGRGNGRDQGVKVELANGTTRSCYAYRLAAVPTPTFAKGDRALSQNGDYVTVDTDPDEVGHVWVSFGTTKWRTPVSWLSKWEPKVGDRVKFNTKTPDGGPVYHEGDLTVHSVNGRTAGITYPLFGHWTDKPLTQDAYIADLEPLPVAEQPVAEPSLWAPVAGKYGKTRDGRKARVEKADNCKYPFRAGGNHYNADGSHFYGEANKDLVAEWVEPVAEPEAEPTKYKVGDEVLLRGGSTAKIIEVRTPAQIQRGSFPFVHDGGDGSWHAVDADGRSRIGKAALDIVSKAEPAAPPAKFKVGNRVRIVKNNRPDQKHLNEEIGKEFTITTADGPNDVGWSGAASENDYWWEESELELVSSAPTTSTLPIGSTVTFTATGRLSAINDNGHMQVTFPDLAPAQNSFALPAKYVALAN